MNTFGRLFRVSIFGESHGPGVGVAIDGCPAGLPLTVEDFDSDLRRRRPGKPGTTTRDEADVPLIRSGVYRQKTTGAPIAIWFENQDVDSSAYDKIEKTPRPGHADLTASRKYGGHNDHRGGGAFSGRLTVGLAAAGVIAKKLLGDISITARLLEAGGSVDVEAAVRAAQRDGDSVGGLVECRASGLPIGLGEPFFDSVESLISHLVFAIGGVRGIEFGSGFASAAMRGSECNDQILDAGGRTATNHAGGVNGGLTNGNELVFRVAVKPTSSIAKPQTTVDLETGQQTTLTIEGRHDACIALRVPPVVEAACAIVLADLMLLEQKV